MAKQVIKATKGSKATTSKSKPAEFVARAKRAGVAAIEAAGGNAASVAIVTPPRMVIGGADTTKAEQCLAMLRKAHTIGDYIAARDKAGMGATLGGYLPGWVEKGYVRVGKGKATKAPKAKAAKPASESASVE